MTDLRTAARQLGGEVSGRAILCPGPGHSARDRSLSVMFCASAPDGFVVWSHCGDDSLAAKDYVRQRLRFGGYSRPEPAEDYVDRRFFNTGCALAIWSEARTPLGTPVERYLAGRGLALPDDTGEVIRFHPSCPFAGTRTPAMVALVRDVRTNQPVAIHRTALGSEGGQVVAKARLSLAPFRGGAAKLTADAAVTTSLGVGEGIESTLSLQRLPEFCGSPVWAMLSSGRLATLPVLPGIECLWIAVDHDRGGMEASDQVRQRWRRAGREVFLVRAKAEGADINDLVRPRHG